MNDSFRAFSRPVMHKKGLCLRAMALTAAVGLFVNSIGYAATRTTVVAKLPGWVILKTKDSMTDSFSCTLFSAKYDNVFINGDSINISMARRGGVSSYQYRFDNEKATSMQPRMEGFDSPEVWRNMDMERILSSSRLLVRIHPIIGSLTEYEIDLSNAKKGYDIMTSNKCTE